MTKVKICVELSEAVYREYEREAKRREVSVEQLLEQTVHALLKENEREEQEGTDHPVIPA